VLLRVVISSWVYDFLSALVRAKTVRSGGVGGRGAQIERGASRRARHQQAVAAALRATTPPQQRAQTCVTREGAGEMAS